MVTQESNDSTKFLQNLKTFNVETPSGTMLSEQIKNNFSKGIQNLSLTPGVEIVSSATSEESGNQAKTTVFSTNAKTFRENHLLSEEVFGPTTINVSTNDRAEMLKIAEELDGHLTATIHGTEKDLTEYADLVKILEQKVGRLIFNGFPTGVEVCHSMVHGGPFPATTAPQSTSVGTLAIKRFSRPVCYQDFPQQALPNPLKEGNPLKIWRMVNGEIMKD